MEFSCCFCALLTVKYWRFFTLVLFGFKNEHIFWKYNPGKMLDLPIFDSQKSPKTLRKLHIMSQLYAAKVCQLFCNTRYANPSRVIVQLYRLIFYSTNLHPSRHLPHFRLLHSSDSRIMSWVNMGKCLDIIAETIFRWTISMCAKH